MADPISRKREASIDRYGASASEVSVQERLVALANPLLLVDMHLGVACVVFGVRVDHGELDDAREQEAVAEQDVDVESSRVGHSGQIGTTVQREESHRQDAGHA